MTYVLCEPTFRNIDFMIGTIGDEDIKLDDFIIYDVTIFKNEKITYKKTEVVSIRDCEFYDTQTELMRDVLPHIFGEY